MINDDNSNNFKNQSLDIFLLFYLSTFLSLYIDDLLSAIGDKSHSKKAARMEHCSPVPRAQALC